MRLIIVGTLICCLGILNAVGQEDNTYWYVNGEKYYWHYQDDVYAYRNVSQGPSELFLDSNLVEYHFHRGSHRDRLNIIYFKPGISESDRESVIQSIRYSSDFESEFPVVTLYPELAYRAAAWFVMDDLILVNFKRGSLNNSSFSNLKQTYGLQQINFPDSVSPNQAIHTYIFEYDIEKNWPDNAIDLSKLIYLNEKSLVSNVQPNLINAYQEVTDESSDLFRGGSNIDIIKKDIKYYVVNNYDQSLKVFVDLNNHQIDVNIRVYDLFGREVYKYKITSNKTQHNMDISDFVRGHYFSCIETTKGEILVTQKFQKL